MQAQRTARAIASVGLWACTRTDFDAVTNASSCQNENFSEVPREHKFKHALCKRMSTAMIITCNTLTQDEYNRRVYIVSATNVYILHIMIANMAGCVIPSSCCKLQIAGL